MAAIHNKIKVLRSQNGLTQQEMADKLNMHLKTWQKIENGVTKLDIDRVKQIAEILDTTIEDLINAEEGVYINEIKNNDVGFNNSSITIQHKSEIEVQLFERLLKEKDSKITDLQTEISRLWDLLNRLSPEKQAK